MIKKFTIRQINIVKFFAVIVLLLLTNKNFAQIKNESELTQAAQKAFAGVDISKKNGPLAKAGYELALLKEEFNNYKALGSIGSFQPSNTAIMLVNEDVVVDVVSVGDPSLLEPELKNLGMKVKGVSGPVISGYLPINSIDFAASLKNVRFLRPSMCETRSGLVTTQGDKAMGSDLVRANLGYDGTGVTVGVLSDSYDYRGGAEDDILSGDLPGVDNPDGHTTPINIIQDNGTTDEGRAMLQIVHDVAPGASLAFATAFGGQATFANNILNLRYDAGADVIVDDVFYYAEPFFQDGIIAQAVDNVVADGAAYFSAAGNNARKSYESVWRPGITHEASEFTGDPFYGGTSFDFDPGEGVDDLQGFTLNPGATFFVVLQWDSPFASACIDCPGSQNDLDIYLLDETGTYIYFSSSYNNINSDAVEILVITNQGSSPIPLNFMIVKFSGDDPGFIKYIDFRSGLTNLEYATNSSTLVGHANATGAEAVAAAAYYNTPAFNNGNSPLLESFSSYGPTAVRFTADGTSTYEAREEKPEITAPDGVNTTFFWADISQDADTFPNFFGTSAAAPHAAAVAALMLQADSTLTPAQIYSQLESNAIDMGPAGFDNGSGYGLVQAYTAPLPVELISLDVQKVNTGVKINWTTATEVNNYGFEIERKSPDQSWNKIGFVKGYGNSNSTKNYSYTDNASVASNKYSYRLKQIDIDGKFTYSNAVDINLIAPANFSLSQNYPNPFNPSTVINYELPKEGNVSLKIFDVLGREVATLVNQVQQAGTYRLTWEPKNISNGVYFYQLKTDYYSDIKKMIFLK